MNILRRKFDDLIDGTEITEYVLTNSNGIEVSVIDYGCIITKILAPDKNGKSENIVLGFDTISEYVNHSPYFGAIVGRVAGRIKGATFELDCERYYLATNDGRNHIHGGIVGFDKVVWKADVEKSYDEVRVVFSHLSPDGDENYPGNLNMKVIYSLNNKNELKLIYKGVSDKKTILNVTNHSYFNLSGNLKRDILSHELTLKSDNFLELDSELMPTGNIRDVEGTGFDFRNGRKIGDSLSSSDSQNIIAGNGYDHPFILSKNENKEIVLKDNLSGRTLEMETNQVGVVLYTGTQLSENFSIRGVNSKKFLGLCLETQGLPDAVNQPNFPTCVVEKDEEYMAYTKLTFGITV